MREGQTFKTCHVQVFEIRFGTFLLSIKNFKYKTMFWKFYFAELRK